jgi:hypothetical protein
MYQAGQQIVRDGHLRAQSPDSAMLLRDVEPARLRVPFERANVASLLRDTQTLFGMDPVRRFPHARRLPGVVD